MLAYEISVLWAPTHPLSLNICSSSSKFKSEAMQEIQDNTSVDTCLDLPNGLMRSYLVIPTYLMEHFVEFFTLPWVVEMWNLYYVSPTWPLFKINRREYDTIILWFLDIRHSDTLFGMWFLNSAQQMFLLILPSKGFLNDGTTQVMYIVKLKSCPKGVWKGF
jgi:hypothetical protein